MFDHNICLKCQEKRKKLSTAATLNIYVCTFYVKEKKMINRENVLCVDTLSCVWNYGTR